MIEKDEMEWSLELKGPNCPDCNIPTEPTIYNEDNIELRAWKCPKCHFIILHPIDANFMLKLKKQKIEVTVDILNDNYIIQIPELLRYYYNLKKGHKLSIEPKSNTEFVLKVMQ
ncbi:MAG: hypothetical protein ACE5KT_10890 [Methanosarcinales archaeon]